MLINRNYSEQSLAEPQVTYENQGDQSINTEPHYSIKAFIYKRQYCKEKSAGIEWINV